MFEFENLVRAKYEQPGVEPESRWVDEIDLEDAMPESAELPEPPAD